MTWLGCGGALVVIRWLSYSAYDQEALGLFPAWYINTFLISICQSKTARCQRTQKKEYIYGGTTVHYNLILSAWYESNIK